MQVLNHGSRWPTMGAERARYTRGSTDDGPGVIINRIGGTSSPIPDFASGLIYATSIRELCAGLMDRTQFSRIRWRPRNRHIGLLLQREFHDTGDQLVAVSVAEWFAQADTEGKPFVVQIDRRGNMQTIRKALQLLFHRR